MAANPETLTDDQVQGALRELPGWTGDAKAIRRSVEAPSFPDGIRLVDSVAAEAEEANHHPDIDIRWTTVTFALTTHSMGGVTQADVDMAGRIDGVIQKAIGELSQ